MRKKPVIIIAGPTASGKTGIASRVCEHIGGEIISADSRQVYKFLDVGTNKSGLYDPARRLRLTPGGTPQHLTDIVDPRGHFSAGDFVREALRIIRELSAAGKASVVTGGTGLYIKALVHGLAPLPDKDEELRLKLRKELDERGIEYLYEKLKALDPVSAEKNRLNPQRLIRAIEICTLTGKPVSALHAATVKPDLTFLQFAPEWDREELYANINRRAKDMVNGGMVGETGKLLSEGFGKDCPGLGSLGYNHVIEHLSGNISLDETAKLIALDTRHYAKRQMTWFRGQADLKWIKCGGSPFDPTDAASKIIKAYENMI